MDIHMADSDIPDANRFFLFFRLPENRKCENYVITWKETHTGIIHVVRNSLV